jgi:hypothetical protein
MARGTGASASHASDSQIAPTHRYRTHMKFAELHTGLQDFHQSRSYDLNELWEVATGTVDSTVRAKERALVSGTRLGGDAPLLRRILWEFILLNECLLRHDIALIVEGRP